jgi:hypothetical protein
VANHLGRYRAAVGRRGDADPPSSVSWQAHLRERREFENKRLVMFCWPGWAISFVRKGKGMTADGAFAHSRKTSDSFLRESKS